MSKIMSVFEKLNLVEKAVAENNDSKETNTSHNDYLPVHEELESNNIDENIEQESVEESQYLKANNEVRSSEKAQVKHNSKLSIQEIYTSYEIENSDINTVFMLGNFINALPDSLPYEIKKKSLISIVASSNMDLTKLLGDGEKRLDALSEFASNYYKSTVNTVDEYKRKITELRNQINSYEDLIRVNETLLKEQNNIIKYEIDKVEGIINFFKDGN